MFKVFRNHKLDQSHHTLLAKVADAAVAVVGEAFADPFDEIRGHMTVSILRGWIDKNVNGVAATHCALYHNREKRTISAFLMANDGAFLFDSKGKRLAVTFAAVSVDEEIRKLFSDDKMVVIEL